MVKKVGVIIFPSLQTTETRVHDQVSFPKLADAIIERNRSKNTDGLPGRKGKK
jgi:hypothetical protein